MRMVCEGEEEGEEGRVGRHLGLLQSHPEPPCVSVCAHKKR